MPSGPCGITDTSCIRSRNHSWTSFAQGETPVVSLLINRQVASDNAGGEGVTPEYFALVAARLVAGRFLTDVDNAPAGAGPPGGSAEGNGRWFESLARFDHLWNTSVVSRI